LWWYKNAETKAICTTFIIIILYYPCLSEKKNSAVDLNIVENFSKIFYFLFPECVWLHPWAKNNRVLQIITENNKSINGHMRKVTRQLANPKEFE
jgi:hypothetical protein